MKKFLKENLNIINTSFISLAISFMFFGSFLRKESFINLQDFSYILYIILFLSFIFIILNKIGNQFKLKTYLFPCLFILFSILAVIFSGDIKSCIYGAPGRYEGLLSIMTYFSLFIISSFIDDELYKKIIINIFMILASLTIIYGILEHFKIIFHTSLYPESLFGNSNSFGIICLLVTTLSLALFLFTSHKFYIIYFLISFMGLVASGSMGCIVGFIASTVGLFLYFILKKEKINFIKIIILVLCIIPIFIWTISSKKHIGDDIKTTANEVTQILNGNGKKSFGTRRFEIWSAGIKVVPKYLVHGVGIDRYQYAMGDFRTSANQTVDKAHNEFLQILVTEGIFALIIYLIFLIQVIKHSWQNIKIDYIYIALFISIIGYLVQSFFGISVTRVTPYFYIIMGLSTHSKKYG